MELSGILRGCLCVCVCVCVCVWVGGFFFFFLFSPPPGLRSLCMNQQDCFFFFFLFFLSWSAWIWVCVIVGTFSAEGSRQRVFVCVKEFLKNKRGDGRATDCSNCACNSLHHSSWRLFVNARLRFPLCLLSIRRSLLMRSILLPALPLHLALPLVLVHPSKPCFET